MPFDPHVDPVPRAMRARNRLTAATFVVTGLAASGVGIHLAQSEEAKKAASSTIADKEAAATTTGTANTKATASATSTPSSSSGSNGSPNTTNQFTRVRPVTGGTSDAVTKARAS